MATHPHGESRGQVAVTIIPKADGGDGDGDGDILNVKLSTGRAAWESKAAKEYAKKNPAVPPSPPLPPSTDLERELSLAHRTPRTSYVQFGGSDQQRYDWWNEPRQKGHN